MMQRCGSYQCYSAGECSCGGFYGQQGSYFSMPTYNNYYETEHYSFESSSPVDCTLSLGTPSTRMTEYDEKRREEQHPASNFTWDLPRTKHPHSSKTTRRGANSGADKSNANADQMFARHCANCDTTTTPLWRNGPSGPKSLCNACGIRYKKEERKAASSGQPANAIMYRNEASSWLQHHTHSQRTPRFAHGITNELNPSVAFLSWSLNDTEQPQLYYDFTS
ncbi:GATA transcription factor 18 [Benincasa hispida]|uniref:GATA transcription factor 18 n=1 Tax=Benincasa hispida TaxID=102211 RepID=UPI0019003686|nr:GATA transcription factor 18 [Benincasa hispida]